MFSTNELLVAGAIANTMLGFQSSLASAARGEYEPGPSTNRVLVGYCPPGEQSSGQSVYQYQGPYYADREGCIISMRHTACVRVASNEGYRRAEKKIDKFIQLFNKQKYKDRLFWIAGNYSILYEERDIIKISKVHNLYRAIYGNNKLNNQKKAHLVEKLKNANYGYLEYLTEMFESASFEIIKGFISSTLPVAVQNMEENYNDQFQYPTFTNNLYLSLFKNPNITEEQCRILIQDLYQQYKISSVRNYNTLLLSNEVIGYIRGDKILEDLLFDIYSFLRLKYLTDLRLKLINSGHFPISAEENVIARILVSPNLREKTLNLYLDLCNGIHSLGFQPTSVYPLIEIYYSAYFKELDSVQEIEREYEKFQNYMANRDCVSYPALNSLRDNVKNMADNRILTLLSEAKVDEKPQNIREFLGKQPNASCWACLWPRTTPSQKRYDELQLQVKKPVRERQSDLKNC